MIPHTDAYAKLKEQTDGIFDFVVTVCYAVPSLKKEIKFANADSSWKVPSPDFFVHDKSSNQRLIERAREYKPYLASYVLISSFSFFEAYVSDALNEMIQFHGGREGFTAMARQKIDSFLASADPGILKHKRKIQEHVDHGKEHKYQKHTNILTKAGFRFPTELLSAYGASRFTEALSNFRAARIPNIVRDALRLPISQSQIDRFHQIRNMRNRIAHGESVNLPLGESIGMNGELHDLARSIDQHLVENYFVLEQFS